MASYQAFKFSEKTLQRKDKSDKDMIKMIAYKSTEFPVKKNQMNINFIVYENKQVYPVHLSENRLGVIAKIWINVPFVVNFMMQKIFE